jgi:transcriptional regulator with XRE-family HTH domain
MNIGGRIRFYRRLRDYSQGELASRVGMAAAQLSRYETGHTQPGIAVLARIARALDVAVSDFFF